MRIEKLLTAMMEYDHGDVPRIQHFVKVCIYYQKKEGKKKQF